MSQRIIPIIIIFFLILLAAGSYFLWLPKYQEFGNKKTEVEGKDAEIKQKEERLSELEAISGKLSAYSSEVSKINSALPSEPSVAAIFNFIQKATSENGLVLSDTDIGELYSLESSEETIQKMPFSISISGSYPAFKNFLSSLYKNSRLVEVESISFASPTEEKKGSIFIFDLKLLTHAHAR